MYYLHLFDPWHFPLCTCPTKYSVDPYTGCEHRCIYCYITSYIPNAWKVRPKKDFLRLFERDLKNAPRVLPVSLSNSSDPYPRMEREKRITRGALNLMKKYGFPVLILTKSDLVVRDSDILSDMRAVVSITITTLREDIAEEMEPNAPGPEERLRAISQLKDRGIKVAVRIDPVIPGINDDLEDLKNLVKELHSLEVDQIISSTYKAKPDNFKRLTAVFREKSEYLREIYYERNEMVRGIRYAPKELRFKILKEIRDMAKRYEIPFSVCREGLDLNTAKTCDASHLL